MPHRSREWTPILTMLLFSLGLCLWIGIAAVKVNGSLAAIFTLPTLAPTLPLPSATATATITPTATDTATATPSPSATHTPSRTPTATSTATPWPTHTATATPWPTATPTPFYFPPTATPNPLISPTATISGALPIPTPVPTVEVPPDEINIVVLGSDRRPDWEDWHTDVVQIVSIQPAVPAVTVLSIPRDLYVYIPGFWMSRINFADMYGETYGYEGGGFGLLQQTMLYNLGIPIHHYVRTDFDGLIGIVDTLGGIDIPVHCRLQDYWPYPDENGEYPIKVLEPGVHHMDGETALWYARSRKTTSTFDRERRQQQVLQAIWRKARSLDLLPQVPQLWGQFQGMVATDMEFNEVASLAAIAFRLDERNIRFRNIGYRQVTPWTTPYGGSVFLPNWEAIAPVVGEALGPVPQGRLWRTLQTVEVWNGTTHADWDQLAADRLVREGFGVVIGQADRRDYQHTRLVNFTTTTKGSAAPYLQQMFAIAPDEVISNPDPNAGAAYRLIIGADYQTCRRP